MSVSPVVHVRGLCESVVEADLVEALEKFGTIWYVSQSLSHFGTLKHKNSSVPLLTILLLTYKPGAWAIKI